MNNTKITKVWLSRRRSKPIIIFRFANGREKEKWLDCSIEDAERIVAKLRADITLGLLGFKDIFPEEMRQKLPFSRFLESYKQYRREQIGAGISAKTYQKDCSYLKPYLTVTDIAPYLERARAGFVFFEVTDGHSIGQFFRRAAQKLEIKAKFHDLRDTHITLSIERGRSHFTASKSAGHSDFKTTEKRYLQITRAMLAEGIEEITDF